jgi:hypothetical protein
MMGADSPGSCEDRESPRECVHQLVTVLGLDRLTETDRLAVRRGAPGAANDRAQMFWAWEPTLADDLPGIGLDTSPTAEFVVEDGVATWSDLEMGPSDIVAVGQAP